MGAHLGTDRVGASRWELQRTNEGWKVTRRTLRPLDGNDEARSLLRQALAKWLYA